MKLDLHTHCFESHNVTRPTIEFVSAIVDCARRRGLDGLAITEHDSKACGYAVKEMVDTIFDGVIVVIPGCEIKHGSDHIVELDLPGQVTFRFLAHPWKIPKDDSFYRNCVHGVEMANGYWALDEGLVKEFALRHDLVLLSNSDAHSIADIGLHHTEIDIDSLVSAGLSKARVKMVPAHFPITRGIESGEK